MDEAFLALLDKKNFAYITVKEICEAAGVNRSTFYLHYETMADLLSESVSHMNEQFLAHMKKDTDAFVTKMRDCPMDGLYLITPEYLTPYLGYIEQHNRLYAQQRKMLPCWKWIKAMNGCSAMCSCRSSTATAYRNGTDRISWRSYFLLAAFYTPLNHIYNIRNGIDAVVFEPFRDNCH